MLKPARAAWVALSPVFHAVDRTVLRLLVTIAYPRLYYDATTVSNINLLFYAFFQRVIGFNRWVPWPVHCASRATAWRKVSLGRRANPGFSPGCYIQAENGIQVGSNLRMGPDGCIISANHDRDDYDEHVVSRPIRLGDDVLIGANSVVLPGVEIGSNVIIDAGSVVKDDIPSNSIAAGNPCRVVAVKPPYQGKSWKT